MGDDFIVLHQDFFNGMPWPKSVGEPSFSERFVPRFADETFRITDIQMGSHIGTHIDAPNHFFPGAKSIDSYSIDRFIGPGVVLSIPKDGPDPITVAEVRQAGTITSGDIVLIYTGWARKFATDEYLSHPYLHIETARYLVEQKVKLVGTDTITPDMPVTIRPDPFNPPVHRELLGNDVLILENLGVGAEFVTSLPLFLIACPLRIRDSDGAPAVVLARRTT